MQFDFLKKAKKNEIIAFTFLICAFILAGYFFLFLNPAVLRIMDLSSKISKLQSDLTIADLAISGMPKLEKEVADLKNKAVAYSNKLPREEEFPALLESLSMMAQNTDVKITKITPIKDTEAQFAEKKALSVIYQEKGILINAQCGYHQLGTFVSELENAERFMEISDITIESVAATPRQHKVQLIVKTFILKDKNR